MTQPTIERLRDVFDYDPQTGHLTWRLQLNPRGKVGARAGYPFNHNGRRYIQIDNYRSYDSRITWAWVTGAWPDKTVDHIDCDPTNNRWSNLRLATQSQQEFNTHRRRDNTSGEKGVWKTHTGRWAVEAHVNKRKIYLGTFTDKEQAIAARRAAVQKLHGEFVRHD